MKYYEVRYAIYNDGNKEIDRRSMPIAAKNKKEAYIKCGEKLAAHSIIYAVEIPYKLYHSWGE
jgi:hypothetical protein